MIKSFINKFIPRFKNVSLTDNHGFSSAGVFINNDAFLLGISTKSLPEIYQPIRVISNRLSDMRMKFVYYDRNNVRVPASEFPQFRSISHIAVTPCRHYTYNEFWEEIVKNLYYYGKSYISIYSSNGRKWLMPIDPQSVSETLTTNGFEYKIGAETPSPDSVIRISLVGVNSQGVNQYPELIKTTRLAHIYTNHFLNKYDDQPFVVNTGSADKFDPDQSKILSNSFKSKRLSNEPLIVSDSVKVSSIDINNITDNSLITLKDHVAKQWAAIFGVPFHMVQGNTTSKSTETAQEIKMFNKDVIGSLSEKITSALTQALVAPVLGDAPITTRFEFNSNRLDYQSPSSLADQYTKYVASGIMTPNEVRKLLNMEPLTSRELTNE